MRFAFERLYFWLRYRDGEARAIAQVRHSMRSLGFPIDITDEELIDGVRRLVAAVAGMGISAEQAASAIRATQHRT